MATNVATAQATGQTTSQARGQAKSHITTYAASRRQRGSGLFFAVILMMLCFILGTQIQYRSTITLSRTLNMLDANSIPLYGGAAETLAQAQLLQDFYLNDVDTTGEDWAQPLQLPFGDGALASKISDLQGCFNLNNLVAATAPAASAESNTNSNANSNADSNNSDNASTTVADPDTYQAQFRRIMTAQLADTPGANADNISNAIIDWVDADTIETIPGGAEDISYSRADNPYRTANARFTSLSELRLIQGVTPEIYAVLTQTDDDNRRTFCVLPAHGTSLNVNFANANVLSSLHPDFSLADGQTLFESLPHASHNEFLEHALFDSDPENEVGSNTGFNSNVGSITENEPAKRKEPAMPTSVVSTYFLSEAQITLNGRTQTLYSFLKRDGGGAVEIIQRTRSVF